MKAGWEVKTLGEACQVFTDGNWIETKDQSTEGIRLVQTGNVGLGVFKDRRDKARFISENTFRDLKCFEVLPGDCLISRLPDPVGRACEIPETNDRMITAVDCSIVRTDPKKMDKNYFIYFSQSRAYLNEVDSLCSGTTRRRISRKNLGKINIPLPPLEEQKRIVSILDEAFEGLDRARENAEANLKSARELFSEAIRLNLRERDNWVSAKLSKCFRLKSGDNLTSKSMVSGPFEVYGGNGVAGKHNASNLSGDNVIVGRVGALCGRARCISDEIWLTDNAFKVVDYKYDFEPRFLARLLNFLNLGSLARQAAQPVISNSSLKDLILQFPKERSKQTAIADNLDKYEFKIDTARGHYQTKLQDISDLRQSLLQKAFSGELT